MTNKDINALQDSLNTLHKLKQIMVNPEGGYYKDNKQWDKIAKLHMMEHCAHPIQELGTPDGDNTEGPKNLHIIYAKEPWRVSNKCEPLPQMTKYLQQLDAIQIQHHCMHAYYRFILNLDPDNQHKDDQLDTGEDEGTQDNSQQTDKSQTSYSKTDLYSVAYPDPGVHIAKTPTHHNVAGDKHT